MSFNVLKDVVNPRSNFRKSLVLFHIFRALKLKVGSAEPKNKETLCLDNLRLTFVRLLLL